MANRVQAEAWEGAGYPPLPPRDPAHEPIDWFETDYDDEFYDPDAPSIDPFPTERYYRVPGMSD